MSAAVPVAAGSQVASSPVSQSPPLTFSDLHNNTQPLAAAVAGNAQAHMLSQSLTHLLLPSADPAATRQQAFLTIPEVQQRLTAACTAYSTATTALKHAREGRERFVNSASKNGGSKQLPAKLDWKFSKQAHLSSDSVPAGFYATDQATLRAIEREATDKAYDALLAAKDKHIAFLDKQCVLRDFVVTAAHSFRPQLDQIAASYNQHSGADPLASSQADFIFPTAVVASYFESELHNRLNAQTLATVAAERLQQQRAAGELSEEHKSQELVLAGAHTGETIAKLAEKEVNKKLAPLQRQLADLQKQLLQQQAQKSSHRDQQHSHHRQPHAAAASSHPAPARHNKPALHQPSRHVTFQTKATQKRARDSETDGDAIVQNPPASSPADAEPTGNKRRRTVVVTLPSKNGAGGDRPPRSDQQPLRSSKPAHAPHHQRARNQGRGPRSDDQQPQRHQ